MYQNRVRDSEKEETMLRNAIATLSLALAGTAALSGNLTEPSVVEPVAVPVMVPVENAQDWTGFYVGGDVTRGDLQASSLSTNAGYEGFGVHAGYLHDFGSIVAGGEVEYKVGQLARSGDTETLSFKSIVGYDFGSFLPYVTVGVSNVGLSIPASAGGPASFDDSLGFVGVGGSYAVSDNFRVGAEYLVHDTENFAGYGSDIQLDSLSLRASFSF